MTNSGPQSKPQLGLITLSFSKHNRRSRNLVELTLDWEETVARILVIVRSPPQGRNSRS